MQLIVIDPEHIVDTDILDALSTRGIEMNVLVYDSQDMEIIHTPGDVYLLTELPKQKDDGQSWPQGAWFYLGRERDTRAASVALVTGAEDALFVNESGWIELFSIRLWRLKYQVDSRLKELEGWEGQPSIIMNDALELVHMSESLGTRMKVSFADWQGKLLFDLFPLLRDSWTDYINTVRRGGTVSAEEFELVLPDGSISWMNWQLRKEGHYIVLVLIDVSERVNLLQRFEQLQIELDLSRQDLQEFVNAASHDMKEPLRMVGNFVQLLEHRYRSEVGDDGKTYIDYAVLGVSRMWALIDELLSYANLSEGKLITNQVQVENIVDAILLDLQDLIEEKRTVILRKDLPKAIKAIDSHIKILFKHLISNALLYNERAVREITIECIEEEKNWYFSIVDNGMGIDPDYHDKVFYLFKRLHRKEEIPGQGMGLGICRKIIQLHGGKIWLVSAVGRGTAVHFTIPK